MTVKITRTISNQYFIGKTIHSGNVTSIEQPYEIIMSVDGSQLVPLDKFLLGKDINVITLDNSNLIYSEEPVENVRNAYLETISGIEVPKNEIIV